MKKYCFKKNCTFFVFIVECILTTDYFCSLQPRQHVFSLCPSCQGFHVQNHTARAPLPFLTSHQLCHSQHTASFPYTTGPHSPSHISLCPCFATMQWLCCAICVVSQPAFPISLCTLQRGHWMVLRFLLLGLVLVLWVFFKKK